jgi:hypothetical protein
MATRPIFIPDLIGFPYVKTVEVEFDWHSGFSKEQAQRSIASLHAAAAQLNFSPILEISSKSKDALGVSLSAFNLQLQVSGHPPMSVECAFQGSKVFDAGGPYTDLYATSSREAKKDNRIRTSGNLIGFRFLGEDFPTIPDTTFYDWLYLLALSQNRILADQLEKYRAFSDIAFSPKKSINCQARSAALYVTLSSIVDIENVVYDKDYFWRVVENEIPITFQKGNVVRQLSLPFDPPSS